MLILKMKLILKLIPISPDTSTDTNTDTNTDLDSDLETNSLLELEQGTFKFKPRLSIKTRFKISDNLVP